MAEGAAAGRPAVDRPCLTEDELWAVSRRGLYRLAAGATIEHHVDRCHACRMLIADLARVMALLLGGVRLGRHRARAIPRRRPRTWV